MSTTTAIALVSLLGAAAFFVAGLLAGIRRQRKEETTADRAAERQRADLRDANREARQQLEAELDRLRDRLAEAEASHASTEDAALAEERDRLGAEVRALTEQRDRLARERDDAAAAHDRLRVQHDQTKLAYQRYQQRERRLNEERDRLQARIEELLQTELPKNAMTEETRAELSGLRDEVGALKQRISDLRSENVLLAKERDRATSELEAVKAASAQGDTVGGGEEDSG